MFEYVDIAQLCWKGCSTLPSYWEYLWRTSCSWGEDRQVDVPVKKGRTTSSEIHHTKSPRKRTTPNTEAKNISTKEGKIDNPEWLLSLEITSQNSICELFVFFILLLLIQVLYFMMQCITKGKSIKQIQFKRLEIEHTQSRSMYRNLMIIHDVKMLLVTDCGAESTCTMYVVQ